MANETPTSDSAFPTLNMAYNRVFQPGRLSLGLVVPLEAYAVGAAPQMDQDVARIQLAEALGFAAVWLRDVPFDVPSFGDVGQIYDPFVYLGLLAGATQHIGLGVASIILPLRHPAHIAKAAASVDVLSKGRLLMGIASGDRPEEYPAFKAGYRDRGERFRDNVAYLRAMAEGFPRFTNALGRTDGQMDLLPKPTAGQLPLLITGGSQQAPEWVAQNGDGWITYPRDPQAQSRVVADYRARIAAAGLADKPVSQSLYVDLLEDPDAPPSGIHLGFRSGTAFLLDYLRQIEALGINHVALRALFDLIGSILFLDWGVRSSG
ncbi:MAG: LLM class oxidoreductase [Rhodospirillaceae bacterium]